MSQVEQTEKAIMKCRKTNRAPRPHTHTHTHTIRYDVLFSVKGKGKVEVAPVLN